MSEVADFRNTSAETLLNVDRAHKAFEKVQTELVEAMQAAQRKVETEFNPVLFESQSVLYEAMAKAAAAGFTYEQMAQTMNCENH